MLANSPKPKPFPSWSRTRRSIVGAALLVGLLQVALGTVWWVMNLSAVPAYGDTPEYVALAHTLRVDGYRTLAYPMFVRLSLDVSGRTGLPWQLPVYLGQTALAAATTYYFLRSVAPAVSRRAVILGTALVTTSPLVVHYATTVLSDSLATSFFVLALVGFARAAVCGDRSWRTAAVTFCGTLGAAFVRAEKATVLLVVAGVAIVVILAARWRRSSWGRQNFRIVGVVAIVSLVLPALMAMTVNRATQTADYGRPKPSLVTAAVSRIVWPHLAEIRDDLPAVARARISHDDAVAFDTNNNNALPMTLLFQQLDGGGDAVAWAAVHQALRCCAVSVAAATVGDAGEYAIAPITFAVEGTAAILPSSPPPTAGLMPTLWDVSRMRAAHPALTEAFLVVSWVLLLLLAAACLASRVGADSSPPARAGRRRRVQMLVVLWLGTVVNGCLFAAAEGADANLRYALSNIVVLTGALVVCALARDVGATRSARDRQPGAPGSDRSDVGLAAGVPGRG